MEELLIEEKAKRYDKAIERAKNYYSTTDSSSDIKLIGLIFPELKESEDERIRGNIIATIHLYYGEPLDDEAKEMIAWLEKQGEHNPYGQRQECIDCQFNYAGECKGSCAMKRSEQKPAETEKGAKGNEKEIPFIEPPLTIKHAREVMGIKQDDAWSKEDEKFVHGLIRGLSAKRDIHGHTTFSSDGIDITKTIDWLKSLKERYTWKPSDEQMITLRHVISGCSYDIEPLVEIEEHLKKLRKE